jgi:hypothetical protein
MSNGNPCLKSDLASWSSGIETASDELRSANEMSCAPQTTSRAIAEITAVLSPVPRRLACGETTTPALLPHRRISHLAAGLNLSQTPTVNVQSERFRGVSFAGRMPGLSCCETASAASTVRLLISSF